MILHEAVPKAVTIEQITEAANRDKTLQKIIQCVKSNHWYKDPDIRPYFQIRNELSIKKNLLLKNNCIVIPTELQQQVLNIAHASHQGITKTKAILREKVWWVGISSAVEQVIKTCHSCQVTTSSKVKCEPIQMSEIPKRPWDTLAIDLKGPFPTGEHLLVLIDYRSRCPVVAKLNNISARTIIKSLKKIFAIFGYPKRITADNGKQFTSTEFKEYLSHHGIRLRCVTPYWPAANGEVERFNRTIGKAIQCIHAEGNDWRLHLDEFLLEYRTTPHSITGKPRCFTRRCVSKTIN